MPFKPPINNPLTEAQSESLAKFNAMKTFLAAPSLKKLINIPKNLQISSYDYLIRMATSIVGASLIDILLKSFLDKLFDSANGKLRKMIIKGLAKATTVSEEWLTNNVFKSFPNFPDTEAIALLIIAMIFGPKEKMKKYSDASGGNLTADDLLNSACCSDQIFSLSNSPSEPQGNVEYNKVQLRKRLEKGNVEFVISCQSVEIKLPGNLDDTLKSNIINTADIFSNLNNYVSQEIHRQNVPSNVNAINKSFMQTLNEKIFSLIVTAIKMQLVPILTSAPLLGQAKPFLDLINEEKGGDPLKFDDVIPSSCSVVDMSNNKEEVKKKTSFYSVLLNMMYALLISILFTEITNRVKKLIKNLLAQKAIRRAEKNKERQKRRLLYLEGGAAEKIQNAKKLADNAQMVKGALASINSIYELIKDI